MPIFGRDSRQVKEVAAGAHAAMLFDEDPDIDNLVEGGLSNFRFLTPEELGYLN
jgi:hypothetical protein